MKGQGRQRGRRHSLRSGSTQFGTLPFLDRQRLMKYPLFFKVRCESLSSNELSKCSFSNSGSSHHKIIQITWQHSLSYIPQTLLSMLWLSYFFASLFYPTTSLLRYFHFISMSMHGFYLRDLLTSAEGIQPFGFGFREHLGSTI